ncbi:MAG: DUF4386 domain-containing protein [Calditrichaceae bacterium]|nr:DUF4386 domain-containing protein [Calditrichaceae bacterium]
MFSMQKIAKIAGFGYLIIFITGFFSNFFVLENLYIPGDGFATATNIVHSDILYRIGIFSFILMVLFDVLLAWALYMILIPVNKNLSLLSGWLRLVNATIFGIALYNLIIVLKLLSKNAYLKTFGTEQLHAQVLLFFETFNITWLIGLIFFGLHLLVMGYLIYKSGYISKIIGILLLVAGIGYLIDSFANFLLPDYANYKDIFLIIVIVPGIIGELSLTFWLLFKSKKIPKLMETQ